eukprot:m.184797 g.184797  ORF g.184797 m.184797 type:complete len:589 (+) comp15563_c0_seq7:156-1922(+)
MSVFICMLLLCFTRGVFSSGCPDGGELLFNGICLPKQWPPRIYHSHDPPLPSYLTNKPPLINVTIGRQLFVDDFLIDKSMTKGVAITYHNATYRDDVNPVLRPTENWENVSHGTDPYPLFAFASPFSGGLFWDPLDSLYKMWYRCGPGKQCYATSTDGIKWDKPILDVVPGTNIVNDNTIDGSTVWLDVDPNVPKEERYKMAAVFAYNHYRSYTILYSSDGIHWNVVLNQTGPIEDRSSIFLNPTRTPRKWVYSIKSGPKPDAEGPFGRSRSYWEVDRLEVGANWSTYSDADVQDENSAYNWTNADKFDPPWGCGSENYTQLYNLDAVAYESVIVGLFSIFTGKYCPSGAGMNRTGEWDSVFLGFSRDGFSWSRPIIDGQHRVFLPMDAHVVHGDDWRWNKANVQSVGGGFTMGSKSGSPLRFYVGARTGPDQIIGNATCGFAELRRDGFASIGMEPGAETSVLVTPLLTASNMNYLFVNANNTDDMKIALLDSTGKAIPGHAASDYRGTVPASSGDRLLVKWSGNSSVSDYGTSGVRLQITFTSSQAALYSFWVSSDTCGASQGWVAAGGEGFTSSRDTHGSGECSQ